LKLKRMPWEALAVTRLHAACALLVLTGAVLALAAPIAAQDPPARAVFVVAPDGDDSAPGTEERPWRTISHAARSAPPGSLVDVRGGTYAERVMVEVSGAPGKPTTFMAHPGERVTITGRGQRGLRFEAGLIQIRGDSNLEFVGFELRDLVETRGRAVPAGVWISGRASDIELRGLDIHGIRTRGGDAHGIAVYGTSGSSPIRDVTIAENNVHDLRLGSSEAVAINGNVDGWRVTGNTIDDVDNIGVDAIGFEGTAPRDDRARNGVIAGNAISDVDTRGNPAYREDGGNCRCAGGVYVDGGRDIVVEGNRVTRANIGIELASEDRRGTTSDVLVRNNLVTRSDRAGLSAGGYDTRRGTTRRVHVVNNTFLDADRLRQGTGVLDLQYRVHDSSFLNNVFRARPRGVLVTNHFRRGSGNSFDGNAWFSPDRAAERAGWQWRKRTVRGFEAWRRATGGDAAGQYGDPLVDAGGLPLAGSPLIDAGVETPLAGDQDLAGAQRLQGAALDVGAFEAAP
jgi:hypothetical protein